MTTETTTKAALRPLMAEDADTVAAIFYDGVLHGTAPHYSEEERQAWAGPRPDPERWRDRMKTDELDPLPYAEGALAPPH